MIPHDASPRLLPPGLESGSGPETELTADHLLDHLIQVGAPAVRGLGFRTRLQALARAGSRFLDPSDPLRKEAEARIPDDAGLSAAGAREVLDGMARDWTLDRLAATVRAEFPDPDVLDGFRPGVRGERIRAMPPRLLVQVCAGNVPGTGATALLRGLLVGAPTLLKPGTGDAVLPELMARALRDESEVMAQGLAVVGWEGGGGSELERRALARAERVVVYGGEDAVAAVRDAAGPLTPVVIYGPKVSAGIVLNDATGAHGPVQDAAAAVAAYEQRGCVSPHLIWVQEGGRRSPEAWAEALAGALAALRIRTEGAGHPLDSSTAAAMRGLMTGSEFRAAGGSTDRVWGGPAEGWMVLFEPGNRPFEPSCLGRTVRVRPLPDPEILEATLEPVRGRIQSVALEAAEPGRSTTALHLVRWGVSRVTTFGDQPWPPAWWMHDGDGPLRALVRWATLEPADHAGPA